MVWTIALGVRWTACQRDCFVAQAELWGLPTLYAKGAEFDAIHWREPKPSGRVVPPEGGAAETNATQEAQYSFKL